MIVGIDEVGRGPWAGPLVVGAVVLGGVQIDGLTDSKKLSKKRREELNEIILKTAAGYGLGWVTSGEIDDLGLSASLRLGAIRAIEQIKTPYHEIVIDGTVNFIKDTAKGGYVTTMKKADLLVPSVSAASIIAKVARDNYMAEQDEIYPEYGFKSHVGYGTAAHRAAIEAYGVTPLHRLSFAPLVKYSNFKTEPESASKNNNSTKSIGDLAESVAADYLSSLGHVVLERNWKTRFCEIDIVSSHDSTIYFTEVKYRKTSNQGGGMAAVTTKKLRQMKFAAEFYATKNKLVGTDLRLAVVDMSGEPPEVLTYLEIS